ncbi:hypothetical protein CONLIGDRAFT_645132 [Coniochaeta ligniaria NRRL 30616]|uniref:Uncharacterized protein n=1 Tax=Coniochaeta ligniaria NRRL 30616 TaxID=1408157 RepID=A0A1J7JMP4_9PEZI|nr:hypothetical protein CONLIGDRAFT_645132 [Coniochaeta ligniaria NRRL 30616]
MGGMPAGAPTPAGHQAELNYIYGMVEELSRQLAENKRALEDVVSGVGRVRTRARQHTLGNEEIIASAADEITAQEQNLDHLISLLSEALEKAKYSRDANAALLAQYASVVSTMLKQFHEYKAKHVADVAAWHRSYRAQLAEARAENCRLREQIWDMQAHAGHANEALRKFRSTYDDDSARWEQRVENKALRQEVRFWKRMAMPELSEDDAVWSDDDDLIDEAEKQRLKRIAEDQAAAQALAAAGERDDGGEEGEDMPQSMPMARMGMGGVPMQRDESAGFGGTPVPPPRPSSASSMGSAGSTGSSGL